MAAGPLTLPLVVESPVRFLVWAFAVMPVVLLAFFGLLFLLGEIGPEVLMVMPMIVIGDFVVLRFFGVVLKKRPYDEMYRLVIQSQLVEMTPFRTNMFGPDMARKMSCFNSDLSGLSIQQETVEKRRRVYIVCLNGPILNRPIMVQRFETAKEAQDFATQLARLTGIKFWRM